MRLVDADRLKQAFITDFWEHFTQTHDSDQVALFEMFCDDLDECPTIDDEFVRHGKWEEITTHNGCTPDYDCVCSICGKSGVPTDQYCHNCGAKME